MTVLAESFVEWNCDDKINLLLGKIHRGYRECREREHVGHVPQIHFVFRE